MCGSRSATELCVDMWWLAVALFLVCIVEVGLNFDTVVPALRLACLQRGNLDKPENFSWFTIFTISTLIMHLGLLRQS